MVGCDSCEISRANTSNVKRDFILQPDYLTKRKIRTSKTFPEKRVSLRIAK